MLPAKYQPNPPGGSGEKEFRMFFFFFFIYGHGGHLEFRIKTILAIFHSPSAWMLHMKFSYIWHSGLEEKSFDSVDRRRTDDGGFPSYKLPRSRRLRGAKN